MTRLLTLLVSVLVAWSAMAAPRLEGSLGNPALWQAYRTAFISPGGRVIDNANGDISHSEGQGYGMLLAVAASDPDTFARLWTWTRSQLMLRDDGLAAWRWDPAATPHVADRNNASDGDLLIAWALAEAGEAWSQPAYRTAALQMIRAIADHDLVETGLGLALRPGTTGFDKGDRPDGPVVNLSYWVFPALSRFAEIAPDRPFTAVIATGLKLAAAAQFGPQRLPSDWISLAATPPTPAKGFPPTFGYDAIRIPLYLAWAGHRTPDVFGPYATAFKSPDQPPQRVDVTTGKVLEPFSDSGYRAVAALTRCPQGKPGLPDDLQGATVDRYYPSTLRALAIIAVGQSQRACP